MTGVVMDEAFLAPNAANFVPLSPLSHLARAADLYPHRPAIIYGARRYTWRRSAPGRGALRRRSRHMVSGAMSSSP